MREHERAALIETIALAERVADQLAAANGHEYCARLARAHALALVDTLRELTAGSSHGGTVDVQTAPGRGTRIALRFPVPS